jgi:hypothetical protein
MSGRLLALIVLGALGLSTYAQVAPAQAEGIGIFPSNVVYRNVLRGGAYYQDIGLVNDSNVERTFRLETGGDVSPWVSFFDIRDRSKQITEVPVPANSSGHVFLRLLVPKDLANGQYRGYIQTLVTVSGTVQGSSSIVNIGAQANVELTVTGTQSLAGTLVDLAVTDTEVGTPLRVRSVLTNSGNVAAQPELSIDLKAVVQGQASRAVGQPGMRKFVQEEQLFPGETKTLITEVPTDNVPPGNYVAAVAVRFDGVAVGDREASVSVHPRGALTRQGELLELRLLNEPKPNGIAKVAAVFINTGQIDSKAAFVGELYHGSDLIRAVTGLERTVSKGEQTTLELLMELPSKGTYRLIGKVNFEGHESDTKELTLNVGLSTGSASLNPWFLVAAATALLALGLLVARVTLSLLSRRRKAVSL